MGFDVFNTQHCSNIKYFHCLQNSLFTCPLYQPPSIILYPCLSLSPELCLLYNVRVGVTQHAVLSDGLNTSLLSSAERCPVIYMYHSVSTQQLRADWLSLSLSSCEKDTGV